MSFRDRMDHVASAAEMDDGKAYRTWLALLDATIAPFTPDGYDASLDSDEWVIVERAYAAKRDAKLIGMQIVHRRGWADDSNDSLMVALRASVALSAVEKRLTYIETRIHSIANFCNGLPQREEFADFRQAVTADVEGLRELVTAATMRKAS